MEFEYHVTQFNMPEYQTGESTVIDIYRDPEQAYKAKLQLEELNKCDDYMYDVVLEPARK